MFDFNVQPGLRTTGVGRGRFLIQDLKSDGPRQWEFTLAKGKMWPLSTLTKTSSPSLDKVGKVNQISKIRNHDFI